MPIAYPQNAAPYTKSGKTYHPGTDLMLAHPYYDKSGDVTKLTYKLLSTISRTGKKYPVGWHASEKMDGLRTLWNGEALVTRSSPGKDPKQFISVPKWFTDALPKHIALDGEIWMGRGSFHDVAGISNCTSCDESKWRQVEYRVFDAPSVKGGFEERFEEATRCIEVCSSQWDKPWGYPIKPVENTIVESSEHLHSMLFRVLHEGGEGIVLRAPGSPYVPRRSKLMLKLKVQNDTEVVVEQIEKGTGKCSDIMGSILGYELGNPSNKVRIGTGFTDVQRRNADTLYPPGTILSVNYMERTPDGKLRMPSFRGVREDM